jgi:outer membrane protein OmpA-like peptidoglycan-associated protein
MSSNNFLMFLAGAAVTVGCAPTVPQELTSARASYERAADGPAAQYTPADLHDAEKSLKSAEKRFKDEGNTVLTRDEAYIAQRKAEYAEVMARLEMFRRGIASAEAQEEAAKAAGAAQTKAELEQTRAALAEQQAQNQQTAAALEAEKKQREEAERRAAQANADLARIAAVKQEDRGTVITLSGSVLFASNKYELLPAAQAKLNQVADALLQNDPDSTFVVEGHTDSQGKAALNQTLSENRARAVRDDLVSHGVAADRITSQGYGSTRPVADNTSAEGRANNRRVEIVISPKKR